MYYEHGDSKTRLYRIWKSMKCRCYSTNHPTYTRYGRRGIEVCDSWKNSYIEFKAWAIAHGYDENLELDRINVNGNYEPENCRWISHHEQTLNRRDTIYVKSSAGLLKLAAFRQLHNIPKQTAYCWSSNGVLQEKLSERVGETVTVLRGGDLG